MSSDLFRAFVVDHADGQATRSLLELPAADLGEGEVTVRVEWSGVNYKDGLASIANGNVARLPRLIPGIDFAGTVVSSDVPEWKVGDAVLAHGYDIGVKHHGGFSELARVPAGWLVRLPQGLTARQAMSVGTAGFTAALSVAALERHGLSVDNGPVLVTGASGGVGSVAVGILAERGYSVTAVTGKESARDWLTALGASEVIGRDEIGDSAKPLLREKWAGAVDCVGGETLASTLASLQYGAAVAASGNTGGIKLPTTVFPFILRGVALLGIDSVQVGLADRAALWERIATDLRPRGLDDLASEVVALDNIESALDRVLQGGNTGRTLVEIGS